MQKITALIKNLIISLTLITSLWASEKQIQNNDAENQNCSKVAVISIEQLTSQHFYTSAYNVGEPEFHFIAARNTLVRGGIDSHIINS